MYHKLDTTLFDRYYLQNCKAITFRKIAIMEMNQMEMN